MKEQYGVDGDFDSSNGIPYIDWTEYAVPVNSISGLISSSSVPSERDMSSFLFRSWEPNSSQSIFASEISDSSYVREVEKEARHSFQHYEDCISGNLEPCYTVLKGERLQMETGMIVRTTCILIKSIT